MSSDETLRQYALALKVGRIKNPNKNPVAEKCIAKLGDELLRICPGVGPISPLSLAVATANLNTHIHNRGLSAREMWLQRDQFTNSQIPVEDLQLLREQHSSRLRNHPVSKKSKAPACSPSTPPPVGVGDLIYITSDGSKNLARNRFLVVSIDGLWCNVRKSAGSQFRSTSYRVKWSECYRIPEHVDPSFNLSHRYNADSYCEDVAEEPRSSESLNEETGPVPVPPHPPSPFVPVVPDELTTPPDPQEAETCSDSELSPAPEGTAPYSATDGPPTDHRDFLTPPVFR